MIQKLEVHLNGDNIFYLKKIFTILFENTQFINQFIS